MKDSLAHIIAVQVLDERIAVLTRRLASLPMELSEREARNSTLELEADGLEAQRMQSQSRANSLETDVLDLQGRIEKLETQSRTLRDAGAVSVAQHEVEEWRNRMGQAEENALKELDIAEDMVGKIKEARDLTTSDAEELEQFRTTVARDQLDLDEDIKGLRERREQRLPSINRSLYEMYERLAPSRKGKPVAPLRGQSCGGCGMVIPPNDQVKVKAASTVATCRGCQRILVEQEMWKAVREATET